MNLDIDLTPFTKSNLKRIRDLNVKHKTIKLLEDNKGENPDDLGYGDDILDTTLKTQSIEEGIDKLDCLQSKSFCSAKDPVKAMRQTKTAENICRRHI